MMTSRLQALLQRGWREVQIPNAPAALGLFWYGLVAFVTFAMFYGRLFTISLVPKFFITDHSAYVEDAQRMFFGERLYKDFFTFTFPGTQYVYYLGFRIFGLRAWVPNAIALALGVLLAVLTFAVAKRVLPEKWAFIAALLSSCFGYGAEISPTHHFFSVAAVLATLVLLLDCDSMLGWAGVGTGAAFIVWFSQMRGISVGLCIAFVIMCGGVGPEPAAWSIRFRWLLCYLGMLISMLAILLASPLYHVGIARFLSCTFGFTFKYGRALRDNRFFYNFTWEGLGIAPGLLNIRHILEPLFTFILVPTACTIMLALLIQSNRKSIRQHRRVFTITAVLLFSYASVLPSPTTIRVAPDASLAFLLFVWYLREHAKSFRLVLVPLVLIGLSLAAYRLRPAQIVYLNTSAGQIAVGTAASGELAWETEHIRPGTFFLSTNYGDYFPVEARNPMPFAFLTNTPFTPTWQVEKTIQHLQEDDVHYVKWDYKELDVKHPAAAEGDNLEPLRNYIHRHYRPIFTSGDCNYFARIESPNDGQAPR